MKLHSQSFKVYVEERPGLSKYETVSVSNEHTFVHSQK